MSQTRAAPEEAGSAEQGAAKRARTDEGPAATNGSASAASTSASAPAAAAAEGSHQGANGSDVTEDEAALYDRQIRLWGLEAQNRMRKAHVLVHNLEGIATETIKNIVLSGIGTLTIVDSKQVAEEDLSSGFFYREEDVGKLRIEAAAPRIQTLNPLVKIEKLSDESILQDAEKLKALKLDTVVSTKGSMDELIQLNHRCREVGAKFYASQSQGLGGWLFVDLGDAHSYIVEKSSMAESGPSKGTIVKKKLRYTQAFVTLDAALQKEWKDTAPRLKKRLKITPSFFATLGKWHASAASAEDLQEASLQIAERKGFSQELLFPKPELVEPFFAKFHKLESVQGDFAPTSAVIGGLLAQDVLNSLGGREEPIANWLQLDGMEGHGNIIDLGAGKAELVA